MGDCDLTYDFREIEPFVQQLAAGSEFVMGSRIKGTSSPAPCHGCTASLARLSPPGS